MGFVLQGQAFLSGFEEAMLVGSQLQLRRKLHVVLLLVRPQNTLRMSELIPGKQVCISWIPKTLVA